MLVPNPVAGTVELGYAESTTPNTTTTDATASGIDLPTTPLSIAFATDDRPAMIHARFPSASNSSAGAGGLLFITDAANNVLDAAGIVSAAANQSPGPVDLWVRIPAGTALTTYKVRFSRTGGAGTFTVFALGTGAIRKMFLRAHLL